MVVYTPGYLHSMVDSFKCINTFIVYTEYIIDIIWKQIKIADKYRLYAVKLYHNLGIK